MASRPPSGVVDSAVAYDGYAARYDALLPENRINAHMRNAMTSFEREAFRPGQRLLELGCGTGDEAIALAARGCDVVGIDPSREMVRIAENKSGARALPGRLSFRVGYARDLGSLLESERDGSFDGGYSSFALSYESDLGTVPKQLARLIRPGGIFVAAAMNRVSGLEWALSLASLHPSLAGRRLASVTKHKVGPVETAVYCRSPARLRRDFTPWFEMLDVRGLPVALPPHYANRPLLRWPSLVTALERVDSGIAGWPVLRYLGDHTVVWFRRLDVAPRR